MGAIPGKRRDWRFRGDLRGSCNGQRGEPTMGCCVYYRLHDSGHRCHLLRRTLPKPCNPASRLMLTLWLTSASEPLKTA